MNKRALKTLEYDKIIAMLADRCVSSSGREYAEKIEPSKDRLHVVNYLEETTEAVKYIMTSGISPMRAFDDVGGIVKRAELGSVLNMGQLMRVASFWGVSREVKASITRHEGESPILRALAQQLVEARTMETEIKTCILSEEEMADDASPELLRIRREIRTCQQKVRDKLDSMLRSKSSYLQEGIITMRGGRFVIPVKSEHKGQVPGLVHDVSGSGSTLFVEPMAAVELNNRVKTLMANETEEIQRILAELSAQVGTYAKETITSMKMMTQMDFIFAKGKLSLDMEGVQPKISDEGYMHIKRGRHPLIDKKAIVPIDIWAGKDFDCLIITGPNTGGKTVSLKTAGLFALMTQSGLHIPANDGSEMPLFDEVFADIGDEQSIEQSLSTFSSHMKNIVSILDRTTDKSLVLLDELGAGTDPTEGAALGISILERLIDKGAMILSTTHYSELKAFALSTDGVENAAMEFNVNTLSPTYKMGIGVPGKSNAFEISRRLGLSEEVIDIAREHMSQEAIRFEDVLSRAENMRKKAERDLQRTAADRKDAQTLKKRMEQEYNKLDSQRDKVLDKARSEALQILNTARAEADQIIKELKELQKHGAGNLDRGIQEARDALRGIDKKIGGKPKKKKAKGAGPTDLKPGESVRLIDADALATVLKAPNDKGDIMVQAGIMKLKTHVSNLERTEEKRKEKPKRGPSKLKAQAATMEIDIRGSNAEEGIMEVDIYLDNAFTSSLKSVQIIHGKGTGILRNAIHRHLKTHPHVKSFRLGRYGEGESGVTIVELK